MSRLATTCKTMLTAVRLVGLKLYHCCVLLDHVEFAPISDTSGAGRKRSRFASDDLDSEPGGKRPRQQSTSPRGGKGKGRVPNANAKRELRSPEQVRKERTQKALKGAKHRRGGSAGRGRGRGKR